MLIWQATVPLGGVGGLLFLKRTAAAQKAALTASAPVARDIAHFRERIGRIRTADQLVEDRRLLTVALTAFGLEAEVNNRAFVRKVLEEGTLTPGALANRLAGQAWRDFAAAFGFGDFPVPNTVMSDFPDRILSRFTEQSFERAVGQVDDSLRVALFAARELPQIAARRLSDDGKWYALLGSAPLRSFVQGALGLPQQFAGIDLDSQVSVLRDRTAALFGGQGRVEDLTSPEALATLERRYLVREQALARGGGASGAAAALQMLSAARG